MKGKIFTWALIGLFVVLVFACGCQDNSPGSAYSSGPTSAGEGKNMGIANHAPTSTPGTVAGGTATGGATSTGGQAGQ